MNNSNLKPWQSGQSGNPLGRPKGSVNLSYKINELLQDEEFFKLCSPQMSSAHKCYIDAIIGALASKAIKGDLRAANVLFKYGQLNFAPEIPMTPVVVRIIGADDSLSDMNT